jgi:curved DNA-binding protein CbpA
MKKSVALETLGLRVGATDDEVKAAHRKKVIENHPDKFAQGTKAHAQAEEKTKAINEARDVLLSRKWDPEFSRGAYSNPYASPYQP